METVFIPSWSISVLLVILGAVVAYAILTYDYAVEEAEAETCDDSVEIDNEEFGNIVLCCKKDKGHVKAGDPEHEAWTTDADNESVYFNTWTWTWEQ